MIKHYTLVNPANNKLNFGSIEISDNYNTLKILIAPKETEASKRREVISYYERLLKEFFDRNGIIVHRN